MFFLLLYHASLLSGQAEQSQSNPYTFQANISYINYKPVDILTKVSLGTHHQQSLIGERSGPTRSRAGDLQARRRSVHNQSAAHGLDMSRRKGGLQSLHFLSCC